MRRKRLYAASVVLALMLVLLPPVAHPAEAAVYTVNTTSDRNGTCGDGGLCSLREAINETNSNFGTDTIAFDIDTSGCAGGVCTLTINASYGPLPPLQDTSGGTIIDGATQTTNQGDTNPDGPEIEIDCTNSNAACLRINSANNTIKGLVINRCPWAGVLISGPGADYNEVLACYIGTDATGELDRGNTQSGVVIMSGADYNQIGASGDGNVISANKENGIWISGEGTDDNSVTHNYIGTDKDGETDLGNDLHGISISNHADSNDIGSTSGGHNVISGNGADGIWVNDADGNQLVVNYIGTDKDGEADLGNDLWGIHLQNGTSSNWVGSIEEVTIVSNNGGGILIEGTDTHDNTVIHSYIGTDVDGDTDRGNGGDGVQISNGAQGNTIGGDTEVEKNVISSNGRYGVYINDADNNTASGNHIGTDESGASALGNHSAGVGIDNASNNIIGGNTAGKRNVISGNGTGGSYAGVQISGNANTVQGNHIGLRATGDAAIANSDNGVSISGDGNQVKDNVISGNSGHGLYINGPNTDVTGNIIGLHQDGGSKVPNGGSGIYVNSGDGVVIGGQASGDHNTIAGNDKHGVAIFPATGTISGAIIMGNYIGTNQSDLPSLGNGVVGVYLYQTQYSTIGGDEAGEENVISGNDNSGVVIEGNAAHHNTVSRNYIGLNSSGTSKLSNGRHHGVEIRVGASYNTVGGGASQRNYIGGNDYGVAIHTRSGVNYPHDNQVTDNYIGTNITGTASLGNTTGVAIYDKAHDNTVADNLISGNDQYGVYLFSETYNNVVRGNYIGTNAGGTALGNTSHGIYLDDGARANETGPSNVIAFNGGDGVAVDGGTTIRNTITRNSIFSNDMGIHLTDGANGGIAAPVIAATLVGSVNIVGTACPNCTVEVFENSDTDGEGETYIKDTIADASGAFTATVGSLSNPYLTATATDADNETSEFSAVFTATLPNLSTSTKLVDKTTASAGDVLTYTITLSNTVTGDTTANVTDTLPADVTWTGHFTASTGTPVWDGGNNRLLWSGPVNVGTPVTITYQVTVSVGVPDGTLITNTATVDDRAGNVSETEPVTVTVASYAPGSGGVYLPIITKNYP